MNDDLEEYRHGMPQWPKHLFTGSSGEITEVSATGL